MATTTWMATGLPISCRRDPDPERSTRKLQSESVGHQVGDPRFLLSATSSLGCLTLRVLCKSAQTVGTTPFSLGTEVIMMALYQFSVLASAFLMILEFTSVARTPLLSGQKPYLDVVGS
jgi:hypothetical protein